MIDAHTPPGKKEEIKKNTPRICCCNYPDCSDAECKVYKELKEKETQNGKTRNHRYHRERSSVVEENPKNA